MREGARRTAASEDKFDHISDYHDGREKNELRRVLLQLYERMKEGMVDYGITYLMC